MNRHRLLAVQLRRAIKAEYPTLSFVVRLASASGDNNRAEVEWLGGPTERELAWKFQDIATITGRRSENPPPTAERVVLDSFDPRSRGEVTPYR